MELKYKSNEDLIDAINNYFADCDDKDIPYTVTGLALSLGFQSRQSIYDYADGKIKDQPEYPYTVKNALLKIENYAERHLYSNHVTGAIFALKNRGWTDKHDIDLKGNIIVTFDPAEKDL